MDGGTEADGAADTAPSDVTDQGVNDLWLVDVWLVVFPAGERIATAPATGRDTRMGLDDDWVRSTQRRVGLLVAGRASASVQRADARSKSGGIPALTRNGGPPTTRRSVSGGESGRTMHLVNQ